MSTFKTLAAAKRHERAVQFFKRATVAPRSRDVLVGAGIGALVGAPARIEFKDMPAR